MQYLIDTHVLLWWHGDSSKISPRVFKTIEDAKNTIYVSSVSTWEIIIKKSLGKLKVPSTIFDRIRENNFIELPITIEHTRRLEALPKLHTDPFDRLLIAQALCEGLTIITHDAKIQQYNVKTIHS